ncbi:MAG: hypothetical protein A3F17_03435 [Gammaproteobacteria bacterium RIFCSPHIGHO2_12_FULL_41_15]|nr:MAG: hypothetical protein A3F17_03435 [Gammaproteobacteria bacterium RIFCSPHIGHO2_12_FULL_41_15]
MRIFKTKNFVRWAKKERLSDAALINTINELEVGLIDANLGGGLIKKRVARSGQGKRGGHRVILAFKDSDRSIFLFGFSKNDRENLDTEEKEMYIKIAKMYLGTHMSALEKMCVKGQLVEVHHEKK